MTERIKRLFQLGFHLADGKVRVFRKNFSDGTSIEITNIAGTGVPETFTEKMRVSVYMYGELLSSFTDHSLEEFMALKRKTVDVKVTKEARNGKFIRKSDKKGFRK
jgi:hypothetical protein